MNNNFNISGAWLTVNRYCNFRCVWCYAENTNYGIEKNMSFQKATKIIDFCSEIGIENIIIIGGEPTFWPYLKRMVAYIKKLGMHSSLVTNGFLFSRKNFLNKIIGSGIDSISLSLKAGNRKQFKLLTATDSFFEVARSIENLSRSGIDVNFSITISSLVIHNLKQMIELIVDNGGEHISLEFCTPVFENYNFKKGYALSPRVYADKIVEIYSEIEKIKGIDLWIEQSLPRCVWPIEFIKKLEFRNQIGFGCHVQNRDGIIFDTEGDVIPCNCLNNIKFGNFPKDFDSPDTFHDFWNQRNVLKFYDKFMSYPSFECIECSDYQICGGGCPLNWFSFAPEDVNLKRIA